MPPVQTPHCLVGGRRWGLRHPIGAERKSNNIRRGGRREPKIERKPTGHFRRLVDQTSTCIDPWCTRGRATKGKNNSKTARQQEQYETRSVQTTAKPPNPTQSPGPTQSPRPHTVKESIPIGQYFKTRSHYKTSLGEHARSSSNPRKATMMWKSNYGTEYSDACSRR